MQLHEKYRPKSLDEVIGQRRVVTRLKYLAEKNGYGGHAFWISGKSGTGKTTIAKIVAATFADEFCTEETTGRQLSSDDLIRKTREWITVPMFGGGYALIINEAHGLRSNIMELLLTLIEGLNEWVVIIFTTTKDGQIKFEEKVDSGPLLSRCIELRLTDQGLCEPFATRAKHIAEREGLGGRPLQAYRRLVKSNANNLRKVFLEIEAGAMKT